MTLHRRDEVVCTGGEKADWVGCGGTFTTTGRNELGLCPECIAARDRVRKMRRYRRLAASAGDLTKGTE